MKYFALQESKNKIEMNLHLIGSLENFFSFVFFLNEKNLKIVLYFSFEKSYDITIHTIEKKKKNLTSPDLEILLLFFCCNKLLIDEN